MVFLNCDKPPWQEVAWHPINQKAEGRPCHFPNFGCGCQPQKQISYSEPCRFFVGACTDFLGLRSALTHQRFSNAPTFSTTRLQQLQAHRFSSPCTQLAYGPGRPAYGSEWEGNRLNLCWLCWTNWDLADQWNALGTGGGFCITFSVTKISSSDWTFHSGRHKISTNRSDGLAPQNQPVKELNFRSHHVFGEIRKACYYWGTRAAAQTLYALRPFVVCKNMACKDMGLPEYGMWALKSSSLMRKIMMFHCK